MQADANTPLAPHLQQANVHLTRRRMAPLTDEETRWIYDTLGQIPEFVQARVPVRGRNTKSGNLINPFHFPSEIADVIEKRRSSRGRPVTFDSRMDYRLGIPKAEGIDWVAYLYRESILNQVHDLVRGMGERLNVDPQLLSLIGEMFRTPVMFHHPADRVQWRYQWERSLEINRNAPQREVVVNILLGDRLYGHARREGDPLGADVDRLDISWRNFSSGTRVHPTPASQVEDALERIREEIARRLETLAGPQSRPAREALDRLERGRNTLSPDCDIWTYEELEFWTRYAARHTTSRVVYDWLVQHGPGYGIQFTLDVAPEEVDVSSFEEVADELIRSASKRTLCTLLAASGIGAPAYGQESFTWYEVSLQSPYLPEDAVVQIEREIQELTTSTPQGPLFAPAGAIQEGVIRMLHGEKTALVQVASELLRQRVVGVTELQFYTVSVEAALKTLSLQNTEWMALVGLTGQTPISPVPRSDREVEPFRIVLGRGDLVLIKGRWYEQLVLRSDGGPSRLLVIEFKFSV